ncbi:bacterial regulatory protein, lacI family protein [Asticcacaulis biprosthecium C19]|uniref:Bacterial regulatory protein, lacI family protein n=1 Tax=Asticcacaulis biprosthecium C19 TaxID=715226 RepID=F4QSC5_9CAUL|nr:LacI family DNA-binding transcriptional regulator [Asticcacaulis biprosthecium]EGF89645.1 bacterial regulatory protein, lacI family protein [Asticcacaulis biprosthecium C19]
MADRATLIDIARQAGVSTATVDRVLNRRPGVRDRTRDIVFQTATKLGYIAQSPDTGISRAPVALDFLLPSGSNSFMQNLATALEEVAADRGDIELRLHFIQGFDPYALADTLLKLAGKSRGVGVIALDHPLVREALRQVRNAGTHVVTLISDISNVPRESYIGIDNRAAGRLSGYLLGRLLPKGPAKLALFAGSLSYRGHEEREMGFRHILREDYPGLSIVELREVQDNDERAYEECRLLLRQYPELAGIYNIGAGNRGIAKALEETGMARKIVFIGHELTEHTRRLLLSGVIDAVIDQNPRVEAREAIDQLAQIVRGEALKPFIPIRIQAVFKENIPE